MRWHTISSELTVFSRLLFSGVIVFSAFVGWTIGMVPESTAQTVLPQEVLADLIKPSIVRIAGHISGTARIPEIKVDIRKRFVAVVPGKYTEVPVDEYLVGSGFVLHPDGYIATNAHVVSQETVKQSLASDSALSALYENALYLSDAEMEEFLRTETDDSFSKTVLRYVIEQSFFELKSEVAVLRPGSEKQSIAELLQAGLPARVVAVNENFFEDEKDVALLKIEETGLPALSLGIGADLSVGKKAFIFGFPATAELNQNSLLEATFTQGVISAIKQSVGRDFKIFQTDAKVSQGSSGGPLFDDTGSVTGIITFQTDELSRVQGDNFAFALPIEIVTEAAEDAGILPTEGSYGRYFKQGFTDFSLKRCDKAGDAFHTAIGESSRIFVPESSLTAYFRKCDELRQSGMSLDTRFDEWKGQVKNLGNPFFYLIGMGLVLFGIFGGMLFWILRQVHHEQREIEMLETRLRMDEARIKGYDSLPRPVSHHVARKTAKKGKKIV